MATSSSSSSERLPAANHMATEAHLRLVRMVRRRCAGAGIVDWQERLRDLKSRLREALVAQGETMALADYPQRQGHIRAHVRFLDELAAHCASVGGPRDLLCLQAWILGWLEAHDQDHDAHFRAWFSQRMGDLDDFDF